MKVREVLEALQGVDPEYDVLVAESDGLDSHEIQRVQVIFARIWDDEFLGVLLWTE